AEAGARRAGHYTAEQAEQMREQWPLTEKLVQAKTEAALARGDDSGAVDAVLGLFAMAESLVSIPSASLQTIRHRTYLRGFVLIGRILNQRALPNESLARLASALRGIDLQAGFREAAAGEFVRILERFTKGFGENF